MALGNSFKVERMSTLWVKLRTFEEAFGKFGTRFVQRQYIVGHLGCEAIGSDGVCAAIGCIHFQRAVIGSNAGSAAIGFVHFGRRAIGSDTARLADCCGDNVNTKFVQQ